MKQFNLKEYLKLKEQGKEPKIRLRNGKPARIICIDLLGPTRPVVAAVLEQPGLESLMTYREDGRQTEEGTTSLDLFFENLEPTYRPYQNAEEAYQEARKHNGWYIDEHGTYTAVNTISKERFDCRKFDDVLKYGWKWADDNSPLGIKED